MNNICNATCKGNTKFISVISSSDITNNIPGSSDVFVELLNFILFVYFDIEIFMISILISR